MERSLVNVKAQAKHPNLENEQGKVILVTRAAPALKLKEAGGSNFEGEEEILVDIDKNRPNERKQGPPLLSNLATRINKYWKIEAESHSTVKHLKGLYSTPENCRELVVPNINRELYTKLHPYYIRQDRKYIELQETLMAVTTAVSSIANLALEADKNSQMVDTKQIVTHALNATTLLGCAHQKLNKRRKESIAPALPKEIREVCSSQREVTSWLFGIFGPGYKRS